MKQVFALIIGACLLVGCQSVPATKIVVRKVAGEWMITSPKEIEIHGLRVDKDGSISADKIISKNSPEVIAGVAASNAAMAERALGLSTALLQAAEKGAVKAVLPIP